MKESTLPEVSATCSASGSSRTTSWAPASAAVASSVAEVSSLGVPASSRNVPMPEPRSSRRPAR